MHYILIWPFQNNLSQETAFSLMVNELDFTTDKNLSELRAALRHLMKAKTKIICIHWALICRKSMIPIPLW